MTHLAEQMERQVEATRDLVGLATVALDDPIERAAALLSAATVIIEGEVGTAMATAALHALLQPTLTHWSRSPSRSSGPPPGPA